MAGQPHSKRCVQRSKRLLARVTARSRKGKSNTRLQGYKPLSSRLAREQKKKEGTVYQHWERGWSEPP